VGPSRGEGRLEALPDHFEVGETAFGSFGSVGLGEGGWSFADEQHDRSTASRKLDEQTGNMGYAPDAQSPRSGVRMDSKVILAAAIWVSGFVAGVILAGRWLRIGESELAVTEPTVEQSSTLSVNKVQRGIQRLTGPVAAGASADLLRVRNATRHIRHRAASPVRVSATASRN